MIICSYRDQFTIVPILVGSIPPDVEAIYGKLLAPYLADPQNLFVISSDFCHWGKRFSYTYYDESCGAIHKSIEKLDKNVSLDIRPHHIPFWIFRFCFLFHNSGDEHHRNIEPGCIYGILKTL